MLTFKSKPEDWVSDFDHENGQYQNCCIICGKLFIGYKRRCVCKLCYDQQTKLESNQDE